MNNNWLSADDWKRAQESLPICCVDVLPIGRDSAGRISRIGLILRDTPHQGRRWCVVGGRMLRNESLAEAGARQIVSTLGTGVQFKLDTSAGPHYIAEYFTTDRGIGLLDPRQHSIGITFIAEMSGDVVPQGEAFDFRWFEVSQLPAVKDIGFGQERVIAVCLAKG